MFLMVESNAYAGSNMEFQFRREVGNDMERSKSSSSTVDVAVVVAVVAGTEETEGVSNPRSKGSVEFEFELC